MEKDIVEKLGQGVWMHAGADDLPEVSAMLKDCADRCFRLNSLLPSNSEERMVLLRSLLGSTGSNFVIHSPFRCDFGFNIHIGENFIGNFNLTILDEAEVRIGNNVMIGPNCFLITITHALLPDQRNEGIMQARPITIEDNVWLAANVTVLPGVTIGQGAVIGAGSVVTKSVPADTLAAGVPCRPIRIVTEEDRVEPVF